MTIRLRLTLLYSALFVITIALFGAAVYGILARTLRSEVDSDLDRVLNEVESQYRNANTTPPDGPPSIPPLDVFESENTFVQLWIADDALLMNLTRSLGTFSAHLDAEAINTGRNGYSNVTISDIDLRVKTRPIVVDGQVVAYAQAARSLQSVKDATSQLLTILVALGVGLVAVSGVFGYWMALNVLNPINRINDTARVIVAAEDLKRRVPAARHADELGALIDTVNNMLERLERLFNTQQRFVSDVSHELRTPITSIHGHVELMQRIGYDAESMEAVARSTERMVQLVEDLMMLANADIGRVTPAPTAVELDALLTKVYQYAKTIAKDDVTITLNDVTPIVIEADAKLLTRLLEHLITNAVCYTEPKGEITLGSRTNGKWIEISVQDTGIGIPEESIAQIFDRFYRVDTARTRPGGGSGLGLSISRWIAKAHGGDLSVTSKVGEGSTFTLRLPYNPLSHSR